MACREAVVVDRWERQGPGRYSLRTGPEPELDMSITASEARKSLFPLIKKVNEDHDAIEIVSKHGNAVLVSADDFSALREGAYLLRSPANARRLLTAYENALNGVNLAEHQLIDPDAADPRGGDR